MKIHTPTRSIYQIIQRIREVTAKDIKDVGAAGFKLMEELGEFGEAVNHKLGYLPHKQMKETPFEEAADLIQNTISILCRIYPELTTQQIVDELQYQLDFKTDKWFDVLQRHPERVNPAE